LYVFNTLQSLSPGTDPQTLASKSLTEFLAEYVQRNGTLQNQIPYVIVFDQFEELFNIYTEGWRHQQEEFFRQIAKAVTTDPLLRIALVIREDYLAQLDPFAPIMPEKLKPHFRLERLRREAALLAIKGPLKNTQRNLEEGAAEALVDDLLKVRIENMFGDTVEVLGEFVEPVQLQVVCHRWWQEELASLITQITRKHIGNVDEALESFYEEAIYFTAEKTKVHHGTLREWVEKSLITLTETRSIVHRGPRYTAGLSNEAVEVLEQKHLLTSEWRAGARWYELTHDRLIGPIKSSNEKWKKMRENISNKVTSSFTRAEMLISKNQHTKALDLYNSALKKSEEIDDKWGIMNAHFYIGRTYEDQIQYEEARQHYLTALEIAKEVSDSQAVAFLLSSVGGVLLNTRNYEQAINYYIQALDLYQEINDRAGMANTCYNLAITCMQQKSYDQAINYYIQALDLYQEINDRVGMANTLIGMAYVYDKIEDYESVILAYNELASIDPSKRKECLLGRAGAYWYSGRVQEAISDYNELLQIDPNSFDACMSRGQILAETGEFKQALVDLDRAMKLGRSLDDPVSIAYLRNGRGLAYGGLGQYEKAFREFEASIQAAPDNAWVYYNRALIYERKGEPLKSVSDLKVALTKNDPSLTPLKRETARNLLKKLGEGNESSANGI
jgi:tetratricopeptide (TPR) repeat protein